ncbi:MAG: glycosyltransferase family 2 protein [Candidatus Levybacteria bacterium]|nr:glycosyltransferase family 2 protein [Candidatus Levybacteria bacterium]
MKKIYVIIPAFNEGEVIASVIKNIKKNAFNNIIVVDDGSGDFTSEVAKKEGAIVLRHIINRGKGAAIKTGIEAAKILKADAVVTFDADGQHSPKDIKKMIKKINESYDAVLGCRNFNIKEMPFLRIVANHMGNLITWFFYGIKVRDSQCGLRAYSKKAIFYMDTVNDRYEYDSEVIREISKHKLKFTEVPVSVNYTKYSISKKQKQSFSNSIKMVFKMFATS